LKKGKAFENLLKKGKAFEDLLKKGKKGEGSKRRNWMRKYKGQGVTIEKSRDCRVIL